MASTRTINHQCCWLTDLTNAMWTLWVTDNIVVKWVHAHLDKGLEQLEPPFQHLVKFVKSSFSTTLQFSLKSSSAVPEPLLWLVFWLSAKTFLRSFKSLRIPFTPGFLLQWRTQPAFFSYHSTCGTSSGFFPARQVMSQIPETRVRLCLPFLAVLLTNHWTLFLVVGPHCVRRGAQVKAWLQDACCQALLTPGPKEAPAFFFQPTCCSCFLLSSCGGLSVAASVVLPPGPIFKLPVVRLFS